MDNYDECRLCTREGLLIYPVRYAVACPKGTAHVPALSGNFKIVGAPQEIGTAKYTLRALRAGYIYVYDENGKFVTAYLVLPSGLLWKFPLICKPYRGITAPDPKTVKLGCISKVKTALAHCIDVKHSAKFPAGNIWIGWSNVQWTAATLMKMSDAGWRKLHMQCINIPAMLEGKATHAGEFNASRNNVAHFVAKPDQIRDAFSFSNTPPTHESNFHLWGDTMAETMAAQAPVHKGFIVALNDPVGITNDLSELLMPNQHAGFDETIYRGNLVANILRTTEVRIRNDARNNVEFQDKQLVILKNLPSENDQYSNNSMFWKIIAAGGTKRYDAQVEKERQKTEETLASRQDEAEDKAIALYITQPCPSRIDCNVVAASITRCNPCQMVLTPGSPSLLRPRKPPSWAINRSTSLRRGGSVG